MSHRSNKTKARYCAKHYLDLTNWEIEFIHFVLEKLNTGILLSKPEEVKLTRIHTTLQHGQKRTEKT